MRLRNIMAMLLAVTVLAAGCNKNEIEPSYDSFTVDKTFINIPAEGGSISFTVNSTESWSVYERIVPNVKDDKWNITISPMNGGKGTTTITITSDQTSSDRQMELCFLIGDRNVIDELGKTLDDIKQEYNDELALALDKADEEAVKKVWDKKEKAAENALNSALVAAKRQYVTVRQTMGVSEVQFSTCAEMKQEVADGRTGGIYYAKGSVTNIVNTQYGNWTLMDETGTMYVYTTLDASGNTKNFASLGLSEGDMVELFGTLSKSSEEPQLQNVTITKIEKAFIKLDKNETTVKKDAKKFEVALTVADNARWSISSFFIIKENGNNEEVEEEIDWLSAGTSYVKEGKTYQEILVKDYLVDFAPRSASIRFAAEMTVKEKDKKTGEEKEVVKKTALIFTVNQEGNIPASEKVSSVVNKTSGARVRINGIVMGVNAGGAIVADATGAVYCEGVSDFAVGDSLTVSGAVQSAGKYFRLSDTYAVGIPADTKAIYPAPTELNQEVMDEVVAGNDRMPHYFMLTGTGEVDDDKYFKFTVGQYTVKSEGTASSIYVKNAVGKKVVAYGYCIGLEENEMKVVLTDLKWPEATED